MTDSAEKVFSCPYLSDLTFVPLFSCQQRGGSYHVVVYT